MDQNLEEAAMTLGADEVTTFFRITLPLLWPGILSAALLSFILSFDDFVITSLVAGSGSSTLPLVIYSMVRRNVEPSINAISALIVVATSVLLYVSDRIAAGMNPPMPETRAEALLRAMAAGSIGRREFARRALAIGASATAIAGWLAACQPAGDGLAPAARAARDAAESLEPLGPIEHRLAIYNWSDYVAPDTISNFEREFGVRVTYDVYESNEELLAKLLAGARGYDLVFPSSYALSVLVATGLAGLCTVRT